MPKYYVHDDSGFISNTQTQMGGGAALELCIEAESFEDAVKKYIEVDTGTSTEFLDSDGFPETTVITVFGPQGSKYVTKNYKVDIKVSTTVEIKQQLTSRRKAK